MSEELKPCPFCGGAATILETNFDNEIEWLAMCNNPSCVSCPSVYQATEEMAVSAWNTRVAVQ